MDNHVFAFPLLRPETGSNKQPYLRLLIFINKKKAISQEAFHVWWRSVHADLAVAVEGFGGMHTTPDHKERLVKCGMQPLPFDGMGEMHVRSLDDWVAFQRSPAFVTAMGDDATNFMEGEMSVMLGYDCLIYGKTVGGGGTDGILPEPTRASGGSEVGAKAKL
ncbi:hypothetical protein P171DRAFT_447207 [Karstenula rhodostoma CBS 690.94]|uniref:EthD domain-containing protein n=1 Tax=Karstenula rhodostoma CBS 690.94 TaxID=1392251 RepID=A0A9P4PCK4_9PLEO|nr:hypothetical protein P171DRAFT_447207 [Karstenula rhodostoma CBS 690.94]